MKEAPLIVLLTGANGFVGRHLAPTLTANGMVVRCAVRKPLPHPNTVIISAVGPQTDWNEALFEVDAVVHLAARNHHPGEEHATDMYRSLNTDGTLHLARCAAKAGVRQFIYLSTVIVNGSSTDGRRPFCEDDRLRPPGYTGCRRLPPKPGLYQLPNKRN